MTHSVLLALHIAVLGYWLGSEFVINSEYRFVVRRADLPIAARDALMDHVMKVDQHVRYALVLQAMLGTMLLAGMGLLPSALMWIALLAGIGWLALVETVHRVRKSALGSQLALVDRGLRYAVAAVLVVVAFTSADWPLWLRIKLALFAGVIGCGVLIRFQLIRHFTTWRDMVSQGSTRDREALVQQVYRQATGTLFVLWSLIAAITLLALLKPV